MKPITMRLMTNDRDRGFIQAQLINSQFDVKATIGVGDNRVDNAYPKNKWEWSHTCPAVYGGTSQMARALEIVQSIGPELLRALPKAKRMNPSNKALVRTQTTLRFVRAAQLQRYDFSRT